MMRRQREAQSRASRALCTSNATTAQVLVLFVYVYCDTQSSKCMHIIAPRECAAKLYTSILAVLPSTQLSIVSSY